MSSQSVTTNKNTPYSGSLVSHDSDGDALTFAKVSGPAHGTVVINPNGSFTYTVGDGHGGSATATVQVTVR